VLHGYPDSTREAYVDGAPFEALEGYRERVREVAEALDGPRIRAFRTLAADLAMHVILGFAERADDGRLYNAAAWIARDGQITHVYRKVHLRPFEDAANGRGCFNP
jgi:predicted amidohydrolase